MIYFDRFDICAVYNIYSVLWGGDGCAYENRIQVRLHALAYRPSRSEEYFDCTEWQGPYDSEDEAIAAVCEQYKADENGDDLSDAE